MANFYKAKTKKQPVTNTSPVSMFVTIDKLDSNGCGVGKYNNKPIFVEGALPQEQIEVLIVEQKNKFTRAKLTNVTDASPHRVEPKCKHFYRCGGCDLQHLALSEQISFKEHKISTLFSRYGMSQENVEKLPWQSAVQSSPWHYRRKARIGVQYNKKGQATIGFREKYSNHLVAIKSCPVLVEPLNKVFPLLLALVNQLSAKNAIGHIEVISAKTKHANISTTIVIRQLRPFKSSDQVLIHKCAEQNQWQVLFDHGKNIESSQKKNLNVNTSEENSLQEMLSYSLDDKTNIQFNHGDFIQVNEAMNVKMVEQALCWLNVKKEQVSKDNVLDLFCGLGNFSLALAKHVNSVVGVEGVQAMVDKASENAKQNGLTNLSFYQADLSDSTLYDTALAPKNNTNHWVTNKYNKVLLDPARAGAEQAVKFIAQLQIPTVLYVSCDPETLARDSQELIKQGYKMIKIASLDMFVHTKHVETMVLFEL